MKIGRLILALIGLVALVIAYFTGSLIFLVLAVAAFVAGLYLMGANKKPIKKTDDEKDERKRKNSQR